MDKRYEIYLQYCNEVPHLFDRKNDTHTVKLDCLFSLPLKGEYVKVTPRMNGRKTIIARVAHAGIRFIWETEGTGLNCEILDGDTWEFAN